MPLTPPARLPAALLAQPGNLRYGLFNVAPPQIVPVTFEDENLPAHAFGGGLFYDPPGCGEAHLYPINCDEGEVEAPEKDFDDNSPEIAALPFVVYATLKCGRSGYPVTYMTEKTGRRLFTSEQHAVEAALWAGGVANAPILTDPAGAVDVGGGGAFASIVDAVAALEQHAYGTVPYGYCATIHAQSAVHAYAASEHLVATAAGGFAAVWGASNSEPVLRTPLGSKWVFGGGYPGTGPSGAAPGAGQTYLWVTGMVRVWRDEIWTPPDPERTQFDRTLNEFRFLYERRYLASYDCFHAYALVDIPVPAAEVEP